MMLAIKWAREQRIPFLGICLGFQLAVIEWARNVCGLAGTSHAFLSQFPKVSMEGWGCGAPVSFVPFFRTFSSDVWSVLTSFGITIQVLPPPSSTIRQSTHS